jgi:hypothetical protein
MVQGTALDRAPVPEDQGRLVVKRIIYTVATGADKYAEMAMGLGRSLSLIQDQTPRVVVTDNDKYEWSRYFDKVVEPIEDGTGSPYFAKYSALETTDAEQVLFIDADCLVFKRLDPIFEMCAGSGIALAGRMVSDGTWYETDLGGLCSKLGVSMFPRFNTGVLYYERTDTGLKVIQSARQALSSYEEFGFEKLRGKPSDEPCLAIAMSTTGIGKVLPLSLGLNESGVGLIGKLDLNVLTGTCRFVTGNPNVRLVEPYVFHAHYFAKLSVYWNELEKLKRLERHRDALGPRHMSRWLRLRRSFEKRYLKLTGKL